MNMESFYSGGFLYNPKTKEVLLHKRDGNTKIHPNEWAFFGGTSEKGESPVQTFVREVKEELGISLAATDVKEVRSYFNNDRGTHRHVFYGESELKKEDMKLGEGADFGWFSFEEAFKLDLTAKTREDLIFSKKIKIY